MSNESRIGGNRGVQSKPRAVFAFRLTFFLGLYLSVLSGQTSKTQNAPILVHFTDVREKAGITFLQDATATEEKY